MLTIVAANATVSGIAFPYNQSRPRFADGEQSKSTDRSLERPERLGPQRHLRVCGVRAPGGTAPCRPPAAACIPHAQKPLAAHLLPS